MKVYSEVIIIISGEAAAVPGTEVDPDHGRADPHQPPQHRLRPHRGYGPGRLIHR